MRVRPQPQAISASIKPDNIRPVEKPIADIEDFKSVDQVCLSCPSKGDQALPVNNPSVKKHKGIARKPVK